MSSFIPVHIAHERLSGRVLDSFYRHVQLGPIGLYFKKKTIIFIFKGLTSFMGPNFSMGVGGGGGGGVSDCFLFLRKPIELVIFQEGSGCEANIR